MGHRHVTRLLLLSLAAAGVLAFTVHSTTEPQQAVVAGLAPAGAVGALHRFDESLPHDHEVDPETGGLVSVAPAKGVPCPAPERLGPMHADPMPARRRAVSFPHHHTRPPAPGRPAPGRANRDTDSSPSAPPRPHRSGTPGISTLTSHRDTTPARAPAGTATGSRCSTSTSPRPGCPPSSPILRNEVANVDDVFALSARQTGGERRVRWVRDDSLHAGHQGRHAAPRRAGRRPLPHHRRAPRSSGTTTPTAST